MSKRPIIGLTMNYIGPDEARCPSRSGSYYINRTYVEAVRAAGGIPLYLPYAEDAQEQDELLSRVDGLLLTGGKDLDPHHYGESPHPAAQRILPDRSRADLNFARKAVKTRIPLLGICLGMQTLNVAMGGSLYQDIPDMLPGSLRHQQTEAERDGAAHLVAVERDSLLFKVVGTESLNVNSVHHQAAREIGQGLVVSGRAPDGMVEGLEYPDHPFCLAVQWHPEDLSPTQAAHRALFEAVIEAARRSRSDDRRS